MLVTVREEHCPRTREALFPIVYPYVSGKERRAYYRLTGVSRFDDSRQPFFRHEVNQSADQESSIGRAIFRHVFQFIHKFFAKNFGNSKIIRTFAPAKQDLGA